MRTTSTAIAKRPRPLPGPAREALPPAIERLPAAPAPPGRRLRAAWRAGARLRGLLGTAALPPDAGLWLRPARSVHTLGMRFRVDLVWLDAAAEVVALHEDVGPGRHRSCREAAGGVVEVAAGRGEALAAALATRNADHSPSSGGGDAPPRPRATLDRCPPRAGGTR